MNELTTEDSEQRSRLARIIIQGDRASTRSIVSMAISLSVPSIMAQLANILMQYIDATMVGHIGKDAAAAIGLISTSTWLLWDFARRSPPVSPCRLPTSSEQEEIPTQRLWPDRDTRRHSSSVFSSRQQASPYHHFFRRRSEEPAKSRPGHPSISSSFALSLPAMQLNFPSNNMLRCSGNMLVPGITGVLMCLLDIIFNFSLYFPPRNHTFRATNQYPGIRHGCAGSCIGNRSRRHACVHDFPRGISVAWQFGTQPA